MCNVHLQPLEYVTQGPDGRAVFLSHPGRFYGVSLYETASRSASISLSACFNNFSITLPCLRSHRLTWILLRSFPGRAITDTTQSHSFARAFTHSRRSIMARMA